MGTAMTDRDRDKSFGETALDEPRDFSTWVGPEAEPAARVAPAAPSQLPHGAAPPPQVPPLAPSGGRTPVANEPPPATASPRPYEPTIPLPIPGSGGGIAPPPAKYAPTAPLAAGGFGAAKRLDFGPTEVDDPIDLRSTNSARPGGSKKSPKSLAGSESDSGLKILLAGLVLLILLLVIAIIVGIAGSLTSEDDAAAESADTRST